MEAVAEALASPISTRKQPPGGGILKDLSADYNLAWETRTLIDSFHDQLKAIDRKIRQAQDVSAWIARLRAAPDPAHVLGELTTFKDRSSLAQSSNERITDAIHLFTPVARPASPDSEILSWWRSEIGKPPARNRYDRYRTSWVEFSKREHGATATGRVAEILKAEFAIVAESALSQPITASPEDSARSIMDAVAKHLDVSPDEALWKESTSKYRYFLTVYFAALKRGVPGWLTSLGSQAPVFSWRDCIPSTEQRLDGKLKNCFDQLPRLRELVDRMRADWESCAREFEAQLQARQTRCIDDLVTEIEAAFSSTDLLVADRQSVWLALTATLAMTRQDLEDKVVEAARIAGQAPYPGDPISRIDVSKLLHLLDEYDDAVRSLNLPFVRDREVLRVSLQTPLTHASSVTAEIPRTPIAHRVRNDLITAVQNVESSINAWATLRETSSAWSPAGTLYQLLTQVLPPARLAELLPDLASKRVKNPSEVMATRRDFIAILDELSVEEILPLERAACGTTATGSSTMASTKEQLHESILVAIGLSRRAERRTGSPDVTKYRVS